jgi:CBS-domain-containing membrane protein
MLFPEAALHDPSVMNWARVGAIALAMATITTLMTLLECAHPPAAASALLAAMGYLQQPVQAAGLVVAAVLLVGEAILLNRFLGGLPYPRWRADPRIAKSYGALAGLPGHSGGHWQEMARRIFQRR